MRSASALLLRFSLGLGPLLFACGEAESLPAAAVTPQSTPEMPQQVPGSPSGVPNGDGPPMSGDLESAPEDLSTPTPDPANSQTGSPGAVECFEDSECVEDLTGLTEPQGSVLLLAASCQHLDSGLQPLCECRLRRTPPQGAAPYVFSAYPGNRPGGCSEYSRGPECLYCESEFPGCDIDDAGSCEALCGGFAQRLNQDLARTFSARQRVARCDSAGNCQRVFEVEGKCYRRLPGISEPKSLDCSLSDEALLAMPQAAIEPTCSARPDVSCATSSDCPAGLACQDGGCEPCERECTISDIEVCRGGGACAAGETCAGAVCVPDANLTCSSFTDCPTSQQCVSSGVSWISGRGNADTRTFCL